MMKPKPTPFVYTLIIFTIIFIIWHLFSNYSQLNSHIFPSPFKTFDSFLELTLNGTLLKHSVASLYRVTVGFYLSILFGIPIGIILGRLRIAKLLFNPVIQFLRPISPLAWIPIAMLIFGIGDRPAIFLIFLSSFFPLVVATMFAVQSINQRYFYVAANFDFSKFELVRFVILPAIQSKTLNTLRITISIAWIVVVAAEMIAVKSGLGYLILDSRNALRMDYVMVGMIVIGIIGMVLDLIMKKLIKIKK